jgi:hypothetical protein
LIEIGQIARRLRRGAKLHRMLAQCVSNAPKPRIGDADGERCSPDAARGARYPPRLQPLMAIRAG